MVVKTECNLTNWDKRKGNLAELGDAGCLDQLTRTPRLQRYKELQ